MKYGESAFDLLYLLFAVVSGLSLLRRAENRTQRRMGLAALILAFLRTVRPRRAL